MTGTNIYTDYLVLQYVEYLEWSSHRRGRAFEPPRAHHSISMTYEVFRGLCAGVGLVHMYQVIHIIWKSDPCSFFLTPIKTVLSRLLGGAPGPPGGVPPRTPIAGIRLLRLHNRRAKVFCEAC